MNEYVCMNRHLAVYLNLIMNIANVILSIRQLNLKRKQINHKVLFGTLDKNRSSQIYVIMISGTKCLWS